MENNEVEQRNVRFRKFQADQETAKEIVDKMIGDASGYSHVAIIDGITDEQVKRFVMLDMAMRLLCIRGQFK